MQDEIGSLREGEKERGKYKVGSFLQKIPSFLAERDLMLALMWDLDGDTSLPAQSLSQLAAGVQKPLYI